MIYAKPGQTFEATTSAAPTGLTGTMGVRILDNAGGTFLARQTTGIAEYPAGSGFYAVALVAPIVAGQWTVMWDTGTLTPATTAVEDLVVTHTAPTAALPSGTDLCTLSDVRELLQTKASDTSQDAMITRLVTRASRAIARVCGELALVEAAATHDFEIEGEYLDLFPYVLRTLTSVAIGPTAADLADVDTATVVTLPVVAIEGAFIALRLPEFTANRWDRARARIVGSWGYTPLPEDITMAAAVTVVHWMNVNVGAFRSPEDTPDGAASPRRGIPPEAWDLLGPWRRTVGGG